VWVTTLLVVASYLLITFISFIVISGWGYNCTFNTLISIKTINNVELILIYGLTFASLVGDLFSNASLVFMECKWIVYIFDSDPFWFRAQIILFLPFLIFSLAMEIFTLAATTNYFGVVTNFTSTVALNTTQATILLIIDVLFPLVITIINWIRVSFQKKQNTNALEDILNDKESNVLFAKFCKMEFSVENISCWNDVQEFKRTKQGALDIYDKYLNGGASVMEVNCQKKTCQAILDNIQKNEITDNLFDAIVKDLMTNLSDTYSRFTMWDEYAAIMAYKAQQLEMIEGKK
jgi:hypothetical protein